MPQVEVDEVSEPDLDAQIMAERLAYSLDRGRHYRRAGYYILRKIMDAGATGVEVRISGKVTSQRARCQVFRAGTMKKSGYPAQIAVDKGVAQCIQKSGVLGVMVKIMKPDFKTGDGVKIDEDSLKKAQIRIESRMVKTRVEELAEQGYETEEEKVPMSEEDEELLDEVDEEDITEISLESSEEVEK